MDTARRLKQERMTSSSVAKVISSIQKRGILIEPTLPTYDIDDTVGLIGEIVAGEICVQQGYELLFVKWMIGGTSKSRGIDIVTRRFERMRSELKLVEAKHLHESIKDAPRGSCSHEIRGRFTDGLDEFEREKTLQNLASIIVKMSSARRIAGGTGVIDPQIDEVFQFLRERLGSETYSLEIITSMDAKYYDRNVLAGAVTTIPTPTPLGDHDVCLTLLSIDNCESTTERICEEFVGSQA